VLEESHGYWQELVAGEVDPNEINFNQTSQETLDSFVSRCNTMKELDVPKKEELKPAAAVPEKYSWWYYLDENLELIELP
jgi:inorganic pyrophosphatase